MAGAAEGWPGRCRVASHPSYPSYAAAAAAAACELRMHASEQTGGVTVREGSRQCHLDHLAGLGSRMCACMCMHVRMHVQLYLRALGHRYPTESERRVRAERREGGDVDRGHGASPQAGRANAKTSQGGSECTAGMRSGL